MSAKVVVAGFAAVMLGGCGPLTDSQASDISAGLKAFAKSIGNRKCITREEMFGLRVINGVLEQHKSDDRIVMWVGLPNKICDE